MMSSVALACEDPVQSESEWNKKLTYFDYGFTCVFGVEVLLKVFHNLKAKMHLRQTTTTSFTSSSSRRLLTTD